MEDTLKTVQTEGPLPQIEMPFPEDPHGPKIAPVVNMESKPPETKPEKPKEPTSKPLSKNEITNLLKQDRITLATRDQNGYAFGMVSFSRGCILDVTYIAIHHNMDVTVSSLGFNAGPKPDMIQAMKVNKGKIEYLDSYKQEVLYTLQGGSNTFKITDESEMRRMWAWLGHENLADCPFASLIKMRTDMLVKIEEARIEAEKKKADAQKNAGGGLVDADGNSISSKGT